MNRLNGKRISRRNSRRLNRLIPINELKDIPERKSDQISRSGIIAENSTKKKTDEQLNERTFVSCDKPTNTFVKTNGSVNVHELTKPKKINRSIKKI